MTFVPVLPRGSGALLFPLELAEHRGEGEERDPDRLTLGFLFHRSGSILVNCHATATADRTSMKEASPNPMSAADEAAAPAETAMTPSSTL